MTDLNTRLILSLAVAVIAIGTVFFHFVEGWSWIDAYFFTVITLSTVGYGSLVPATVVGKLATTVLIFVGIGIIAIALSHFGNLIVSARRARTIRHIRERKKAEESDKGFTDR